ncbi:MAG: TfoX/Sxy family protein [Thermoplasmata archaeon]|nr:TfoX/Sxy family protein [Thermoplasmata archaeon]
MPKAAAAAVTVFEGLVPKGENVTSKKMFGQPAAFVNGNLFFGVFGEHIFVRLSDADRADAVRGEGFTTLEPMPGRVMREYLVLPSGVLRDRKSASKWVARSLRYVETIPPKSGKRKSR